MTRAAVSFLPDPGVPFRDGLGERRVVADASGQSHTLLYVRAELTSIPAFEFALRERVARLAAFRDPQFATTISVERVHEPGSVLAIVGDTVDGLRLSDAFIMAAAGGVNLDLSAALFFTRQLVTAVARLHEAFPDVAHGALSPERLILAPGGQLVVADYTLGAALSQLRYSQERYWKDLRIALPRTGGLPRIEPRTDLLQVGLIALSLVLGRSLRDDEYPGRIAELVRTATASATKGGVEPLPVALRHWLAATLQVDGPRAWPSLAAASQGLEDVLRDGHFEVPATAPGWPVQRGANAGAAVASGLEITRPVTTARSGDHLPVVPDEAQAWLLFPTERELGLEPTGPRVSARSSERRAVEERAETPLDAFAPEPVADRPVRRAVEPGPELFSERQTTPSRLWVIVLTAIAIIGVAVATPPIARWWRGVSSLSTALPTAQRGDRGVAGVTGTLTVSTSPPAAQAWLDGRAVGSTPITLTLAPGDYVLELRGDRRERRVPVRIAAGVRLEQYIDLPAPDLPARDLPAR